MTSDSLKCVTCSCDVCVSGDISSESIGNTKSTREFWEKKASESETEVPPGSDANLAVPSIAHEQINNLRKQEVGVKRGGSFRDPTRVSRIPVLKPSGKEYSQEAESLGNTHSNGSHPNPDETLGDSGAKLSIEAMKEHWEKNQRKWGSSTVINTDEDGVDGNGNDSETANENGGQGLTERSADFKNLKEQWNKKNEDRLKNGLENGGKDTSVIDRDKSPGFQALKEEWESKTHDADESL